MDPTAAPNFDTTSTDRRTMCRLFALHAGDRDVAAELRHAEKTQSYA